MTEIDKRPVLEKVVECAETLHHSLENYRLVHNYLESPELLDTLERFITHGHLPHITSNWRSPERALSGSIFEYLVYDTIANDPTLLPYNLRFAKILSPIETRLFYQRTHARLSALTNKGINWGITGLSTPDAILMESGKRNELIIGGTIECKVSPPDDGRRLRILFDHINLVNKKLMRSLDLEHSDVRCRADIRGLLAIPENAVDKMIGYEAFTNRIISIPIPQRLPREIAREILRVI